MRREVVIYTISLILFSLSWLLLCVAINTLVAWAILSKIYQAPKTIDQDNEAVVVTTLAIPDKFSFTINDELINTQITISGLLPSGNFPYKIEDEARTFYHTVIPVGNISDRYKIDGEKSSLVFSLLIDSQEENYLERIDVANSQFSNLKRITLFTSEVPDIAIINTQVYSNYHPFSCIFKNGQCIFTDFANGYPLSVRCESKSGDFSDCDEIIKTLKIEATTLR